MVWQAWLTAGLVIGAIGVLAAGRIASDLALLGVALVLLAAGVITPAEAVRGFSNPGVITVALLYIVSEGVKETGALAALTGRLVGRARTPLGAQARLTIPVTVASAFLNNTPLVAMFLPVVGEMARRTGVAASRLFMPLSFAAILGGVCTLIGTSTNLVVHSMILDYNSGHAGAELARLHMWTISWAGVPVAAVGLAYMLVFGRRLLPDGAGAGEGVARVDGARHYTAAMRVSAGCAIIGKTVESAGLRGLPGLFLSRVEREGETVVAVGPEEVMREGDTLVFVGVVDSVVDLQKIRGLLPVADEGVAGAGRVRARMRLIEGVISPSSPLIGRNIREAGIRSRYGAVVVAVHRHGQRIPGKIGDIVLRPGDTLLLEAAPGFASRHRHSQDFHLVSELEGSAAPHFERARWALVVLLAVVMMLSFEDVLAPMTVAGIGAGLMVALRCVSWRQARESVDWSVILTVGASFAIARALEKTGLAPGIAEWVGRAAAPWGATGAIAAVYVATVLFTNIITHNAAAALMFPVALDLSRQAGVPFTPMAVALCIAASCGFATPLSYQTNLMVMGPGGYGWKDYLRFGGPLTVLCAVVAVAAVRVAWR